jgi:hypothetical protein
MRRSFAGLRAARTRPDKGVRITVAAAGIVFLAACAPTTGSGRSDSAETAVPSIGTTTAAPTTAAPTTTAPVTTTATPAPSTAVAPTTPAPRPAPKPVPRPAPRPAPKPKPVPKPTPKPPPAAPSTCDPNYAGQCLKDGIGDYDCSSGSGNGPNYVHGTVRVIGSDPFGLDRDHDGLGCEDG